MVYGRSLVLRYYPKVVERAVPSAEIPKSDEKVMRAAEKVQRRRIARARRQART